MWAKLQRTVVAILEECFAVDAEEFFGPLGGDPPSGCGHGARKTRAYIPYRVYSQCQAS